MSKHVQYSLGAGDVQQCGPIRADGQARDLSNLGEDVADKGVFTWKTVLDFHMYKHF